MSIPIKHHHLPVFYLKRWVGDDGRLCQFSRPHLEVVAHRKYPSQTAYVERLYELPGLSLDKAQQIEQRFMQRVDSLAAEALTALEDDIARMTQDLRLRSAWSRFIMSLLMRTPEDIATLKSVTSEEWNRAMPRLESEYSAVRTPNDPLTFEEYLALRDPQDVDRWAMSLAPLLIDHPMIGGLLNNMRWLVRRI
jgi:hypothetical protein